MYVIDKILHYQPVLVKLTQLTSQYYCVICSVICTCHYALHSRDEDDASYFSLDSLKRGAHHCTNKRKSLKAT